MQRYELLVHRLLSSASLSADADALSTRSVSVREDERAAAVRKHQEQVRGASAQLRHADRELVALEDAIWRTGTGRGARQGVRQLLDLAHAPKHDYVEIVRVELPAPAPASSDSASAEASTTGRAIEASERQVAALRRREILTSCASRLRKAASGIRARAASSSRWLLAAADLAGRWPGGVVAPAVAAASVRSLVDGARETLLAGCTVTSDGEPRRQPTLREYATALLQWGGAAAGGEGPRGLGAAVALGALPPSSSSSPSSSWVAAAEAIVAARLRPESSPSSAGLPFETPLSQRLADAAGEWSPATAAAAAAATRPGDRAPGDAPVAVARWGGIPPSDPVPSVALIALASSPGGRVSLQPSVRSADAWRTLQSPWRVRVDVLGEASTAPALTSSDPADVVVVGRAVGRVTAGGDMTGAAAVLGAVATSIAVMEAGVSWAAEAEGRAALRAADAVGAEAAAAGTGALGCLWLLSRAGGGSGRGLALLTAACVDEAAVRDPARARAATVLGGMPPAPADDGTCPSLPAVDLPLPGGAAIRVVVEPAPAEPAEPAAWVGSSGPCSVVVRAADAGTSIVKGRPWAAAAAAAALARLLQLHDGATSDAGGGGGGAWSLHARRPTSLYAAAEAAGAWAALAEPGGGTGAQATGADGGLWAAACGPTPRKP